MDELRQLFEQTKPYDLNGQGVFGILLEEAPLLDDNSLQTRLRVMIGNVRELTEKIRSKVKGLSSEQKRDIHYELKGYSRPMGLMDVEHILRRADWKFSTLLSYQTGCNDFKLPSSF